MFEDDYWQYCLYVNGDIIDSFNPIPSLYKELTEVEGVPSVGDPSILCQHWPDIATDELVNYYILWDAESNWNDSRDPLQKAYPHNIYPRGNAWQVADFMKQLGLPFPLDESGKLFGDAYYLKIPRK
jgi:hypothetical protein